MPTRSIDVDGQTLARVSRPAASRSTTATSSRSSSSRGVGADRESARHALLAAWARARANGRSSRCPTRISQRLFGSSQPSDTSPEADYTRVTTPSPARGRGARPSSICTRIRRRRTDRDRRPTSFAKRSASGSRPSR